MEACTESRSESNASRVEPQRETRLQNLKLEDVLTERGCKSRPLRMSFARGQVPPSAERAPDVPRGGTAFRRWGILGFGWVRFAMLGPLGGALTRPGQAW